MADQRLTFSFHKCLGQGGFGEVYLATLTRPGGLAKKVAVKVLKEDLRHAEAAVQRLRDEGRMLAILDHPCILRVLEMTLIQGRVALVTEYIDGIDLARCCRVERLLPPSVVVGALGEVASALNCAWTTPSPETGKALKLIHRDIKPENIRLSRHGEVKLLDFGIARTTEMFRHAKTAQGDLPFTPGYAAPEAFTKGFQGSASDVYALGVTMYRMLTGQRLYEGMELSDQVTICCLNERYSPFLRKRLTAVDAPDSVVLLLKDMLAYEALHRPGAFEVEDRCAALVSELDGPTHVRWARAQNFPEPAGLPNGSLTGQTLEEDVHPVQKRQNRRGVQHRPRARDASDGLLAKPDSTPPPRPVAVADLTPPLTSVPEELVPPPPKRVSAPPSVPPPAPPHLTSLRPQTVTEHAALNAEPTPVKPPRPPPFLAPTPSLEAAPESPRAVEAPQTFDSKATLDAFAMGIEAPEVPPDVAPPPPPDPPMAEIEPPEPRASGGTSLLLLAVVGLVVVAMASFVLFGALGVVLYFLA